MNVIDVSASRSYQVIIGIDLLKDTAAYIQRIIAPAKALIVTDSNVAPLYAEQVANSLKNANIQTTQTWIPAGERSKTLDHFCNLLYTLSNEQLTRSDVIIALGGGVVGDLAGFAASCYLRGIPYIQIPTSLLAMVDSSVGGKTAVNLPKGKNLAGAFYQPSLVLCDINVLNTLPEEHFLEGCAEIVKYGILYDPQILETLLNVGRAFDRQGVIARCIELKRQVVSEDEYDSSIRQMLNFGHTIGHAIERLSDFRVTHGYSVAIGMAVVTRATAALGLCDEVTKNIIIKTLIKLGLPTKTSFNPQDIAKIILSDKKRTGDTINMILPETIGNCVFYPIKTNQLETFLKAGI